VEAKRSLLEAHGFNPTRILVERNWFGRSL
jgi:hypothetical protein